MKKLKLKKQKTDYYSLKTNIIIIGFFFIFSAIIFRLYDLQIKNGDYHRNISLKQRVSGPPDSNRGTIFFRDKNGDFIPAAINKSGFSLAIKPSALENIEEVYEKLSRITEINRDDFFAKAAKKDDPFELLASKIEPEEVEKIKEIQKNNKGIILFQENWRYYPAGNLASHILGFVGFDENKLKGRYGAEEYYNTYLEKGKETKSNFVFGSLLDFSQKVFANFDSKGASVVLTVEPKLQAVLESNLEKVLNDYKAGFSAGIIINPQNGEILAMAVKPDFNPNEYGSVSDISIFKNPLVSGVFEVGSIFKPLTMAAALDAGALTPETKYYDKGFVEFNNKRVENYDGKARGEVDMQVVLNKSLNTGAVFAMERLHKDNFKSYIINYGLNEKTGIDLPGEVAGKINNLDSGRDIEFATASFGQGIAISPLEFAIAASALANGGEIIKPHIVDRIILNNSDETKTGFIGENTDDLNEEKKVEKEIKRRVLSKETSETINRMLTTVVDDAFLDGKAKMDRYRIAAKTGTAQVKEESVPGYSDDYLHTFFGYAPSFDAKFLVFLMLEKPRGAQYASYTLGPSFMDIMKFIFNYYEVPPDR